MQAPTVHCGQDEYHTMFISNVLIHRGERGRLREGARQGEWEGVHRQSGEVRKRADFIFFFRWKTAGVTNNNFFYEPRLSAFNGFYWRQSSSVFTLYEKEDLCYEPRLFSISKAAPSLILWPPLSTSVSNHFVATRRYKNRSQKTIIVTRWDRWLETTAHYTSWYAARIPTEVYGFLTICWWGIKRYYSC